MLHMSQILLYIGVLRLVYVFICGLHFELAESFGQPAYMGVCLVNAADIACCVFRRTMLAVAESAEHTAADSLLAVPTSELMPSYHWWCLYAGSWTSSSLTAAAPGPLCG